MTNVQKIYTRVPAGQTQDRIDKIAEKTSFMNMIMDDLAGLESFAHLYAESNDTEKVESIRDYQHGLKRAAMKFLIGPMR